MQEIGDIDITLMNSFILMVTTVRILHLKQYITGQTKPCLVPLTL